MRGEDQFHFENSTTFVERKQKVRRTFYLVTCMVPPNGRDYAYPKIYARTVIYRLTPSLRFIQRRDYIVPEKETFEAINYLLTNLLVY